MIYEEKHKRNHESEGVCITQYRILFIFTNLNFDFLPLYKMYFQNCFANRYIKLVSFTKHLQHSRYMLILTLPLKTCCK